MNIQEIIAKISFYEEFVPIYIFQSLVNINRKSIKGIIRSNNMVISGSRKAYYIRKEDAINLVYRHRLAIEGGITVPEFARSRKISDKTVNYIIRDRGLEVGRDLLGRRYLSISMMGILDKILKEYVLKDIIYCDGTKYYSLTKTARDMVCKIMGVKDIRFKKYKERIYKTLYCWKTRGLLQSEHKKNGSIRCYISQYEYDKLTKMIRVKDVIDLTGKSRRTIYNWIKKGILRTIESPSMGRMIDIGDMDKALADKLYLKCGGSNDIQGYDILKKCKKSKEDNKRAIKCLKKESCSYDFGLSLNRVINKDKNGSGGSGSMALVDFLPNLEEDEIIKVVREVIGGLRKEDKEIITGILDNGDYGRFEEERVRGILAKIRDGIIKIKDGGEL